MRSAQSTTSLIAVDDGPGIEHSLDAVRAAYPDTELEFCNGGDRSPEADAVPAAEAESAERNRIAMFYGVGGVEKADSSSRITADMEAGS